MEELERKEFEYMQYIQEHKNNVALAFMKYGDKLCELLKIRKIDLSRCITCHDESKYSEEEFNAYRNWFYTCSDEEKDKKAFDEAWKHHYKNNPHHPEYWDHGNGVIDDMPPVYIAEMLCDWEAMSMKFNGNTYKYYLKERDKKPFSENTKKILDIVIKEVFE